MNESHVKSASELLASHENISDFKVLNVDFLVSFSSSKNTGQFKSVTASSSASRTRTFYTCEKIKYKSTLHIKSKQTTSDELNFQVTPQA